MPPQKRKRPARPFDPAKYVVAPPTGTPLPPSVTTAIETGLGRRQQFLTPPVRPLLQTRTGAMGHTLTPGDVITQRQLRPRTIADVAAVMRPQTPAEIGVMEKAIAGEDSGILGAIERGQQAGAAALGRTLAGAAYLLDDIGRSFDKSEVQFLSMLEADGDLIRGAQTWQREQSVLNKLGDWLIGRSREEASALSSAQMHLNPLSVSPLEATSEFAAALPGQLAPMMLFKSPTMAFAFQKMATARAEGITDPKELATRGLVGAVEGRLFKRLNQMPMGPARVGMQALGGAGQEMVDAPLEGRPLTPENVIKSSLANAALDMVMPTGTEANRPLIPEGLFPKGSFSWGELPDKRTAIVFGEQAGLFSGIPLPIDEVSRDPVNWYYSALEQVVTQKFPKKLTADQAMGMLRDPKYGIKAEEYEWSGLAELLAMKAIRGKTVRRDELLQTIRDNQVRVEEKVLGQPTNDPKTTKRIADLTVALDSQRRDVDILRERARYALEFGSQENAIAAKAALNDAEFELHELGTELMHLESGQTFAQRTSQTKFESWKALQGGEPGTYRELLLTLPLKPFQELSIQTLDKVADRAFGRPYEVLSAADRAEATRMASNRAAQDAQFSSSHFSEPNILAHVRFDEGKDAQGNKVLRLQEIQSDWMQQGREKGYKPADADAQLEALAQRKRDIRNQRALRWDDLTPEQIIELDTRLDALTDEQQRLRAASIPNAPFKSNWHELAFKRMLRWASDNGYSRIVWPTGKQQIDLYEDALRQNVDSIDWAQNDNGSFDLTVIKDGNAQTLNELQDLTLERLSEVVGPRIAEQITTGARDWKGDGFFPTGTITGNDLSIGGQIHKLLYDEKLPQFARGVAKKFGGTYGRTTINAGERPPTPNYRIIEVARTDGTTDYVVQDSAGIDGEEYGPYSRRGDAEAARESLILSDESRGAAYGEAEVHYLDLPPKLRASVRYEGQKLFANPIFDPQMWKQLFKGFKRGAPTPEAQQQARDVIDESVREATSANETSASLETTARAYDLSKQARTETRKELRRLEDLRKESGYLNPERLAELDARINAVRESRKQTLEESQHARRQFKLAEAEAVAERKRQEAIPARQRLQTLDLSYRVDPDVPYLEEITNAKGVAKQFFKAAKDAVAAEGYELDPNELVITQLVRMAKEKRIPLSQFNEIFEREGIDATQFLDKLRQDVSTSAAELAYLSHIRRMVNDLAKVNPRLAEAISEQLPSLTELNGMFRERSNWDRLSTVYQGLLVSAFETAQRNLLATGIVTGMDSLGQLFDSAVQNILGAKRFDNRNALSPTLAIRPFINLFGEAINSLRSSNYKQNVGKVSNLVDQMAKAFPEEVDYKLFQILNADLESPAAVGETTPQLLSRWKSEASAMPNDAPKKQKLLDAITKAQARYDRSQSLVTKGFIQAENVVHTLTWANRAQEQISRRAIFEAKLRRYAMEGGIDLGGLIKEGRAAELPVEIVTRAADEALRITFGRRPEKGSKGDLVNKVLKGKVGAAFKLGVIPFPNFLINNFLRFQYEYSPLGVLSLMSAKERANVAKGDMGVFWKSLMGTAIFGLASQMRHSFYEQQGSQMTEDEESRFAKYPRKLLGKPLSKVAPFSAGEKWNEVKVGGKNLDVRFTPFAPAFYVADLLERNKRGLGALTAREGAEAFGFGLRGMEQQADIVTNAIAGIGNAEKEAKSDKLAGQYLGAITAGFLTPLKQVSDLALFWSVEEHKQRDLEGEGFGSGFRNQLQNRVPYWKQSLPEKEVPTRTQAPSRSMPLVRQLTGIPFVEERNYLEKEMETLGVRWNDVVPKVGDPRVDRVIARELGKFMPGVVDALAADSNFTSKTAEDRRQILIDVIFPAYYPDVREAAMAEFPDALLKAEILREFTREERNVENRKRKRQGKPSLEEEAKQLAPSATVKP